MEFRDKVKYVREKLFLSQEAFSKELGVAFVTVNRWESKGIEPQYRAKKLFHEYCETKGIKFEDEKF